MVPEAPWQGEGGALAPVSACHYTSLISAGNWVSQVMILVVSFFVLLTAAALLDVYGPQVHSSDRGQAAASLLGLVLFFALVRCIHSLLKL